MGSKVIFIILRVLVVVIALGVVGMGAWTKFILHDIEARGFIFLNQANLKSRSEDAAWRSFMRTALDNQLRVWIAMAAGSFSTLATGIVLLGVNVQRVRLPVAFLLPLELLSSLSMAAAFGATLSLTLGYPAALPNPNGSSDLASIAMLLPLSRAYAIASGSGMFLGLTSTISFLVHTIHRVRDSKACSFEPTGSSLGMSHDYQIPTKLSEDEIDDDEEKGLVGAGAGLGRSDSMKSKDGASSEWPLEGAKRTEPVIRPHRPWSEMPKP